MLQGLSPHLRAVLQALLVAFLWSTSWVLIKLGLKDIPALTFAGLRYTVAFLCLLILLAASHVRPRNGRSYAAILRDLSRRDWLNLLLLGLLFYAATQGAQYLGLDRLPAATTSLLLSFSAAMIAVLGAWMLAERPSAAQWGGIALYLLGVVIYFYPVSIPARQVVGLVIVLGGVLANALSTVLGRGINRGGAIPPLVVTTVSMGIGAAVLLGAGIAAEGMPRIRWNHALIILWLAVVNTAFAFTLWNHTQRTLSATESGVINNTMLIQIAILAWVFLGEALSAREILGLALAALGTLIVQLYRPHAAAG